VIDTLDARIPDDRRVKAEVISQLKETREKLAVKGKTRTKTRTKAKA
jgi:hypothetical protein